MDIFFFWGAAGGGGVIILPFTYLGDKGMSTFLYFAFEQAKFQRS